jgi:hypothetical protein
VPRPLLLMQLAENDDWFLRELAEHFPDVVPEVRRHARPPSRRCRGRCPRSCMPTATTARRCSSRR